MKFGLKICHLQAIDANFSQLSANCFCNVPNSCFSLDLSCVMLCLWLYHIFVQRTYLYFPRCCLMPCRLSSYMFKSFLLTLEQESHSSFLSMCFEVDHPIINLLAFTFTSYFRQQILLF